MHQNDLIFLMCIPKGKSYAKQKSLKKRAKSVESNDEKIGPKKAGKFCE